MKNLKTKISYALYMVLVVVLLTACKQTFYEYDLEKICKECENKGGVNRFTTDLNDIIVYCKDGSMNRLK